MPLRERFPIFQSRIHLDSCSYGALSNEVRQAYLEYLDDRDRYGSHWEVWVGKLESLRGTLAQLLNASAAEIAMASCLSNCLNSLASAFDFTGVRNKVLLTDFDFPTTAQIWRAQQRRGAVIGCVPCYPGELTIPAERFAEHIDETTLVVSVPHVCYRNGARLDVRPIIDAAHANGALVFLDCYQSVGSMPIDVKALDVDFAAGGTLKYLVSTAGTAFMYVRDSLIAELEPTTSGWFSQADIHAMDIHKNDPAPNARRFETGTPNVASLYASGAGLQLANEVGLETTQQYVSLLNRTIKEKVKENGFQLATPAADHSHGAMLAIRSTDMQRLVAALQARGISTSCRDGNVRVSAHFYNNSDDVEALFAALSDLRELLVMS
ncbi:MAG: aminotransferase class V-fold PLP-dependent enzyme [Gammaproteobacteria bacterium]|nr:aminotransferase class V-fold PLP-dependent enzyme [Gammaproteobacteria bacterium]MCY4281353.1 aminotransferase class V-fold PLP-dependent enzyme [Gammaproteobacteria bacterium]MCY4338277.1 aminotransferase class V-fold PLP-dependent enzyme [Gammaproteobacteria bacterium]